MDTCPFPICYRGLWALRRKCLPKRTEISIATLSLLGSVEALHWDILHAPFDLCLIYFHISTSVSGSGLPRQADVAMSNRDPGMCLSMSACWLTLEGWETIHVGVGRTGGKGCLSPPTSWSNYPIKIYHAFCRGALWPKFALCLHSGITTYFNAFSFP